MRRSSGIHPKASIHVSKAMPANAAAVTSSASYDNDAAGGAFDELRGMIRECEKGTARFDHDYFSK